MRIRLVDASAARRPSHSVVADHARTVGLVPVAAPALANAKDRKRNEISPRLQLIAVLAVLAVVTLMFCVAGWTMIRALSVLPHLRLSPSPVQQGESFSDQGQALRADGEIARFVPRI